jgi:hypothetical protein
MFTIYCKNVGGRKFDRYFRSWENAKALLTEELNDVLNHGWEITRKRDRMNASKGFYEFQYDLVTPDGEEATFSLVDAYFND